jgi:DnaJ-class molecular chaperone
MPSGPLSDPGDDFYDVKPDSWLADCPECEGDGWVWGDAADEPVKEACPRCGGLMDEQRTRRQGEVNAA